MLASVLLFLNIGTSEMVLIMFVVLLLFGGDKMPGIARGLGKGIRDFKDASEGVKREINNQINNYEEKKTSETITPHVEVTEEVKHAETKPLIDTTPVAGTAALGTAQAVPHLSETPIPEGHVGGVNGIEDPASQPHLHSAPEPVKTTHE